MVRVELAVIAEVITTEIFWDDFIEHVWLAKEHDADPI